MIKNSSRYWCADPFVIKDNGINYVFFEMYDRWNRKGVLGYHSIDENGEVSSMKKIWEDTCHLSYPYIFKKDEDFYIMPESNQKAELYLLRAEHFPDRWVKEKVIVDGVKLADTTFLRFQGKDFLFTTPILNDNVSNLSVVSVQNGEIYREDLMHPILTDKSVARQAGDFIYTDEAVIRVSQNCEKTYGGGLVFSKVVAVDNASYKEEFLCSITADDLTLGRKKYDGTHTYNYNEDYEFIDLKINKKFSLIETLGYIRNKFFNR